MDGQTDTSLISHRANHPKEVDKVLPKLLTADTMIALQLMAELIQREALLSTGQAGDDITSQALALRRIHLFKAAAGYTFLLVGVFLLSLGTL